MFVCIVRVNLITLEQYGNLKLTFKRYSTRYHLNVSLLANKWYLTTMKTLSDCVSDQGLLALHFNRVVFTHNNDIYIHAIHNCRSTASDAPPPTTNCVCISKSLQLKQNNNSIIQYLDFYVIINTALVPYSSVAFSGIMLYVRITNNNGNLSLETY